MIHPNVAATLAAVNRGFLPVRGPRVTNPLLGAALGGLVGFGAGVALADPVRAAVGVGSAYAERHARRVRSENPASRLTRFANHGEYSPAYEEFERAEAQFGSTVSRSTQPVLSALARDFAGGRGFTRDELAAELSGQLRGARGQKLSPGSAATRAGLALSELERRGFVVKLGRGLGPMGRPGPMSYALTKTGEERAAAQTHVSGLAEGEALAEREIARLESMAPPPPVRPLSGPVYRPTLHVLETGGHKLPALQKGRIRAAGYRTCNPIRPAAPASGYSEHARAFLEEKIPRLMAEGYPHPQAVAIALDIARRSGLKVPPRAQNAPLLVQHGNLAIAHEGLGAPVPSHPARTPNPFVMLFNPPPGVVGAREAREHYARFHGANPTRWVKVLIDDGLPGVRRKAFSALGFVPATVYEVPFDPRSNKAPRGREPRRVWEHEHELGREPLEVYDPIAHTTLKILDDRTAVDDWWREVG